MEDGLHLLKSKLPHLPGRPGVYRMLGGKGEVLYVGKAKNIQNRLRQYTQVEGLVPRIRKMVFETRELVVVETRTEAEALLLEANLIKTLKPKYNILFRDDASYIRVLITDEPTPLIRSHRGAQSSKGTYFGPYPSAAAVYETLSLMEKIFRLRTCPASTFAHRSRPCLKYDIKRCSGPCVGKISPQAYAESVRLAKQFLKGERADVLKKLQQTMQQASDSLAFEAAATIRDQIKSITALQTSETVAYGLENADVFALVRQGGRAAVQAFYYRNGLHAGNHLFVQKDDPTTPDATALQQFLAFHYTTRPTPPLILTNLEPENAPLLAEALSLTSPRKVKVETPKSGEKKKRVDTAILNATQSLARKSAEEDGWHAQLEAFGTILERPVQTVECYDISNISGRYPVASQVVAGPEGMLKNRYKRYHIKTKNTPDDYAMMREVLTRRLQSGLKTDSLPSVLLVDGGKGQLGILVEVAQELGLWNTPACPALCGIAKGEERDKGLETLFEAIPEGEGSTLRQLPIFYGTPLIFLLQRIRDEAHRFAITFHRQTRAKSVTRSKLDGIPGVGASKKKALLLHFGSVQGVEAATPDDLTKVEGIGQSLAHIIHQTLHKG